MNRESLGRITGLSVFAFFVGRQFLPPAWGGVLPIHGDLLTMTRWFLVTCLFLLFFHAYLIRKPARALASHPVEIFLPLIMAPLPLVIMLLCQYYFQQRDFWLWIHHLPGGTDWFTLWRQTPEQMIVGFLIMACGEVITLLGMWHLRGSFSIFTEVRDLVLTGIYRWVRHPLYTGEILASWGYAIAVPNRLTMIGSLVFTMLQIWRARLEERKLLQYHPDYAHYRQTAGFLWPKWQRNRVMTLLVLFCLQFMVGRSVFAGEKNPLAYRPLPTPRVERTTEATGVTQWLLFPLSLYSNTFSQVDGDRCPSFPNCSHYAREALTRHGVIPGIWLVVDRLIHERTEILREERVRLPDGSLRIPDTLNSNDFWFYQPNQENP
ncbi:MAG: membrane protein insertion efficiency factor YidD [Magnetococcus sp. YQC-5]